MNIITIYSAQSGVGKSTVTANVATLLAAMGRRVGIIDTHLQSDTLHRLFGLPGQKNLQSTLQNYLLNLSLAHRIVAQMDITAQLGVPVDGQIMLFPSDRTHQITNGSLEAGSYLRVFTEGMRTLADTAALDVLLIDTCSGLSEKVLLSLLAFGVCDIAVIMFRLNKDEYQQTGVTIDVAHMFEVPEIVLAVNQAPFEYSPDDIRRESEQAFRNKIGAILPYSPELAHSSSSGLFCLNHPDHPLTTQLYDLAMTLNRTPI